MGFLLTLGGAFVGFVMPDFVLSAKARGRREQVRSELPDALDLLAVSVEAGLGFDGAVSKLTEHMDGALTEEFSLALGEMRIGEGRQEALKKMSERLDTPEVSTFTRAIIQADQLGISLGRILRVQAADTRLKRQAAAEEKAMKAPIKMLFPLVLFIFPAMFIVILMENKGCKKVIGSSQAPYLNRLALGAAFASRYYGLTHPSLPNYLGLTGGSTFGITSDCTDCTVRGGNLVDQLDSAHISWKAYMEGMPAPCFAGAAEGLYAKKHNPFAYYV